MPHRRAGGTTRTGRATPTRRPGADARSSSSPTSRRRRARATCRTSSSAAASPPSSSCRKRATRGGLRRLREHRRHRAGLPPGATPDGQQAADGLPRQRARAAVLAQSARIAPRAATRCRSPRRSAPRRATVGRRRACRYDDYPPPRRDDRFADRRRDDRYDSRGGGYVDDRRDDRYREYDRPRRDDRYDDRRRDYCDERPRYDVERPGTRSAAVTTTTTAVDGGGYDARAPAASSSRRRHRRRPAMPTRRRRRLPPTLLALLRAALAPVRRPRRQASAVRRLATARRLGAPTWGGRRWAAGSVAVDGEGRVARRRRWREPHVGGATRACPRLAHTDGPSPCARWWVVQSVHTDDAAVAVCARQSRPRSPAAARMPGYVAKKRARAAQLTSASSDPTAVTAMATDWQVHGGSRHRRWHSLRRRHRRSRRPRLRRRLRSATASNTLVAGAWYAVSLDVAKGHRRASAVVNVSATTARCSRTILSMPAHGELAATPSRTLRLQRPRGLHDRRRHIRVRRTPPPPASSARRRQRAALDALAQPPRRLVGIDLVRGRRARRPPWRPVRVRGRTRQATIGRRRHTPPALRAFVATPRDGHPSSATRRRGLPVGETVFTLRCQSGSARQGDDLPLTTRATRRSPGPGRLVSPLSRPPADAEPVARCRSAPPGSSPP